MNNKVIQIGLIAFLMLISMLAVSTLLEVRDQTRNVILGIGFFIVLITVLWRKIPFDAKVLFIAILGYSLGGKGFAYLSPVAPVYIGEISLAICFIGFIARMKQWGLVDTTIHKLVWIYLIYSAIHLQIDYTKYQLLAVRDCATAYYAFLFIASFVMFRNTLVLAAFEKVIKLALWFSIIQVGCLLPLILFDLSLTFPGFFPHVDCFMPLNVGCTLFLLIRGLELKNIKYLLLGVAISLLLLSGKTAGVLAFGVVVGAAIVWGRQKILVIPALFLFAVGLVVIAASLMFEFEFITDSILAGETAEAFGIEGGEFVGFSGTSGWRIDWWTLIWNDTMRAAPFWGQGFGADITGPFLEKWLGAEYANPDNYARYPHNIFFTIIGRLGLIGLCIFSALFIMKGLFAVQYCKRYYSSQDRRDADLICFAIVIAGMLNGVLQATYEIPHAAIIHWVCLGYMASRYYAPQLSYTTSQKATPPVNEASHGKSSN